MRATRRPIRAVFARRAPIAVVVLSLLAAAEAAPAKRKLKAMEPTVPQHAVESWLVLGPAPLPFPVFHDEKPGAVGVEDLLKGEYFPRAERGPAAGEAAPWFAGAPLRWTAAEGGADVRLLLDRPQGGANAPAIAWLATYLEADRFQALEMEVTGSQPRRAWLDGEPVAMGGTAKEGTGAEAKGKVHLTPGTHLLLIQTVLDPEREGPWTAGATLRGDKDAKELAGLADRVDPERALDILDVLDATRITSVAVSPDGDLVAAGYSRVLPRTSEGESWVTLRGVRDGKAVRTWRGGASIGQVAWSPVGRRLSYVARDPKPAKADDKETSSLWVADLDDGSANPLLERVENLAGYVWSPDGAAVIYSVTVKPEPDKRGVKLHENLLDRQADYRTKSYLHAVTYAGGARRRLTAGTLSTGVNAISPDGRRLLFTRQVEDLAARPYARNELWELDLATLEAKKLRDFRWSEGFQYAPDGKRILVQAGPSEFGTAGIAVPDEKVPNESDGQLYVWDPTTDTAVCLTREFDPAVTSAWWSRHDGVVYVRAEDKDAIRLFRYDDASKRFAPLDTGVDVLEDTAFAERARVAVATGTSPWEPMSMHAVDLGGGPSRLLDRPAAERYERIRRGTVRPFAFRADGGATIDGRVYLPPGFDEARVGGYPAIVYYYGGTSPVTRDFGGRYPKEWWASLGYVVYVVNPEGATGYGQAYSAVHVNDWGEVSSRQILEGTRRFLDAYPAVDPKRVGCIGASYGGFMTMYLTTRGDLYAAAVSHAGISSISSYWGEGNWGYSYGALASAESFPWNRRDIYVDRSPLFRADKSKTPTLLTHGASDTNVPAGESESFYTALKLLGTPVEFLEVEGQDHWILDHEKRAIWSRSIVAWFDRWLKGRPGWWEELYPKPK